MAETLEYLFRYGSLVSGARHAPGRRPDPQGYVADLLGYRRGFGVAMDNTRDLPGYKYYVLADGSRPAVYVAFLDIAPQAGARVNGVCTPIYARQLDELDARERNYRRTEVTGSIDRTLGRVWTYIGSDGGRRRLERGRDRGAAVISAGYLNAVREAFEALGPVEYARCAPSLEAGELPVCELRRVDLPARREPGPGRAPR